MSKAQNIVVIAKHNKVTSSVLITSEIGAEVKITFRGWKIKGLANNLAMSRDENGEYSLYERVNVVIDNMYNKYRDEIVFNPHSIVDFVKSEIEKSFKC